ncbi:hypothetical protein SELR_18800 [Selenomonas ruminantium subsp. lactilytica TAM6421]|uniref:Uncharacterized protein n=1 Tax=Selenomonas ruminantium subsp. lactilytica (strain NBRC 103574 / TAM6421) TaxID=927704 RepID=I0GS51_SELRL|nr:hypothetical protein SELR_18800 [Selenomonas ruminantium subsp. lactilytica TAM6421]
MPVTSQSTFYAKTANKSRTFFLIFQRKFPQKFSDLLAVIHLNP